MRIVLQRVKSSSVAVAGAVIGQISQGLTLLVGIAPSDTETELDWMARKCLELRVFPDEGGKLSHSVQDIEGELLVISQFTLYGDCRKGRRPSFDRAAPGALAQQRYDQFIAKLNQSGLKIETGQFGAMMNVQIENDGPVTLILEREAPD
ncbi:D-aminoacyl-tRNA deacylase [Acaryochloris thomasi RCC1774]|uniref:D-aminoacyl-tRNA deacylase n=1 Tax=Acaryochloris thomasi RCC1774 TaxID=1764569 RepID=A0A2W1JPX7_9CYAN|nr:D-aminoacyl-tRNA deacylase [Acaryochloris thomasi]PZD75398.1 D-aminoacyl-tRNA deacylase [Acaryochloris thomasi RCC1774]